MRDERRSGCGGGRAASSREDSGCGPLGEPHAKKETRTRASSVSASARIERARRLLTLLLPLELRLKKGDDDAGSVADAGREDEETLGCRNTLASFSKSCLETVGAECCLLKGSMVGAVFEAEGRGWVERRGRKSSSSSSSSSFSRESKEENEECFFFFFFRALTFSFSFFTRHCAPSLESFFSESLATSSTRVSRRVLVGSLAAGGCCRCRCRRRLNSSCCCCCCCFISLSTAPPRAHFFLVAGDLVRFLISTKLLFFGCFLGLREELRGGKRGAGEPGRGRTRR